MVPGNAHILIVDDVAKNIQLLGTILRNQKYKVSFAQSGKNALELVKKNYFHLILLDVMMPELNGFDTCKAIKEMPEKKDIPIIFLTAKTEKEEVVKGFELGAVDYVTKPFNSEELLSRVHAHLTIFFQHQTIERQKELLTKELDITKTLFRDACYKTDGELLGNSNAIKTVREAINKFAQESHHVLLLGEPGCGEEAIARAIHKLSKPTGAFIHVNCSIFDHIYHEEREEFHEFAQKVLLAIDGTLFLENIYHLPPPEQLELLDILTKFSPQIRVVCYCGAKIQTNLHPDLNELLSKQVLHVPTLMERRDDIPALLEYYVDMFFRQKGKNIKRLCETSQSKLHRYSWPGNIEELKNIIERSVAFTPVETSDLIVNDEQLAPGRRVDQYRLLEKIGEGGMGEVWRAKHHALARPVVVKLINQSGKKEDFDINLKRFQLEAEIISQLESPHTVTLYEYGIYQENTIFYVMEMLNGINFEDLITDFVPIPPERTAYLLSQCCLSLMEAHAKGVVHRDIKPQNIFLCKVALQFDFVKIIDFGIVKRLHSNINLTGEHIVGSPFFMAPEMATGEKIDDKVDMYSLGCTAYWLLTGRYVFAADNVMAIIEKHITAAPVPISEYSIFDIPHELDALIMNCLQKQTKRRPSAREMWQELDKIQKKYSWSAQDAQSWWEENLPDIASYKDTI
ncbi:protein kinase domain-containing protein [Candidatus Uabimicrobium amorphum]|uniref:Serine/threonine protein kinase n=1 Tax=Uabimicrobium amorphum TaxID=2596890 RepID=A0A5S9IQH3_UABAM|nr:response regulator [Candidatus Uabimicrobium amorphum]BBM85847.1 serine/threonine protein kinase [Candidatus Uabimicrobium amorphum]